MVELQGITVEGESEILIPRDNTVTKQRLTTEEISETPATKLEDLMVLQAGVQTGGQRRLGPRAAYPRRASGRGRHGGGRRDGA